MPHCHSSLSDAMKSSPSAVFPSRILFGFSKPKTWKVPLPVTASTSLDPSPRLPRVIKGPKPQPYSYAHPSPPPSWLLHAPVTSPSSSNRRHLSPSPPAKDLLPHRSSDRWWGCLSLLSLFGTPRQATVDRSGLAAQLRQALAIPLAAVHRGLRSPMVHGI
jgi:hypothetical protein